MIAADGGAVGLTATETSSPIACNSPDRRRSTVYDQALGEKKLTQGGAFAGQEGCQPPARLTGGDEVNTAMDAAVVFPNLGDEALEGSRPVHSCGTLGSPPIPTTSIETSSTSSPLCSCGDTVVPKEENVSIVPALPPRLVEGGGRAAGIDTAGIDRRRSPEEGPLTCESLCGVELVCGDIFQEPW